MKSITSGTASGCVIWFLVFTTLSLCLCPVAAMVGGFSSTLMADSVAGLLEPYLCPEGSSGEIITFRTTTRDEFGTETPATGYEMQCIDSAGKVVRDASPDYAFYWVGLLAVISFVLSGVLALFLAAPVGALIARWVYRSQKAEKETRVNVP